MRSGRELQYIVKFRFSNNQGSARIMLLARFQDKKLSRGRWSSKCPFHTVPETRSHQPDPLCSGTVLRGGPLLMQGSCRKLSARVEIACSILPRAGYTSTTHSVLRLPTNTVLPVHSHLYHIIQAQ